MASKNNEPRNSHSFGFRETEGVSASNNALKAKTDFLKCPMVSSVYRDYEYIEISCHVPVKRWNLMFQYACIQGGHCEGNAELTDIKNPKLSLPVPGEEPF
jgi:hypothetical protein